MQSILIADDEANLRLLVATTLDDPRYQILEAADGAEALRLAQSAHPDLVLLDWMMPGLSGIEVLQHIKQDPATQGIPVIMLTAKAQTSDIEQGLALGAYAYLTKPFSPLELMDKVEAVLGSEGQ